MSATRAKNSSEVFESENESAYKFGGKTGYKAADTPKLSNANYTLNLVTPDNRISPEAKYISIILDNHPEQYQPEIDIGEKLQVRNRLADKGILTEDYELEPELPEQMLEYAQAATVTEQTDRVDLKDVNIQEDTDIHLEDPEPKDENGTQWFEDYGQDLVRKLNEMDKPIANSRRIAEGLNANPKQIGTGIGRIEDRSEGDYGYSEHSKTKNWHVEKMQEELDLEKIAEEGLDAI